MQREVTQRTSYYQKIWALSWPLMLANISVPLLGMIDAMILGHLGSPVYLASVAVGASFVALVLTSCNFLRMSTTALASRQVENKRASESLDLFRSSVQFALLISVLVILLSPWLADLGTQLMLGKDKTSEIDSYLHEYLQIRFLSAPFTLLNFMLVGWAIAWQKPTLAVISLTVTALVNILLDVIFIMGFGWNSAGAALASVLAEAVSTLTSLVIFSRYFPFLFKQSWFTLPKSSLLWSFLAINRDLFIRTLSLSFSFAFFNHMSAGLGVATVAANAILLQLVAFQSYLLDGFANATEALVGGESKKYRQHILVQSFGMTFLFTLGFSLLSLVMIPWLPGWFTDQVAVQSIIKDLLLFVLLLPLISVFSYWLDGVAVGLQASRAMRNSLLISTFGIFMPLCFLLKSWHNAGLWAAFFAFLLARSLTLAPLLWFESKRV
ncbi:MAG: MATE family efflux transporter [Cellvibrionales bacterium]|nr:MATE family efflux transporter [Cellvibrionales bacterium]